MFFFFRLHVRTQKGYNFDISRQYFTGYPGFSNYFKRPTLSYTLLESSFGFLHFTFRFSNNLNKNRLRIRFLAVSSVFLGEFLYNSRLFPVFSENEHFSRMKTPNFNESNYPDAKGWIFGLTKKRITIKLMSTKTANKLKDKQSSVRLNCRPHRLNRRQNAPRIATISLSCSACSETTEKCAPVWRT